MQRAVVLAVAVVTASACAKRTAVDVAASYEHAVDLQERGSAILFVPGILGSELHTDDGRVVWGKFLGDAPKPRKIPDDLRLMALPWADEVPVTQVMDDVRPGGTLYAVEIDLGAVELTARGYPGVFAGLLEKLMAHGQHGTRLTVDELKGGVSPIDSFGYDWRRALSSEAARLHGEVLALSERRKEHGLDPRVDLVAHSMGTLVTRWYLLYGPTPLGEDGVAPSVDWDPSTLIRQVLIVAPPHAGEASALHKLVEGDAPNALLPPYPPAMLATYPALFALLPRVADGRVVYADDESPVDLFDVAVWERHGWGPFDPDEDEHLAHLMPDTPTPEARRDRARAHLTRVLQHTAALHNALAAPLDVDGIDLHLFVGTGQQTKAVLHVDRETGRLSWAAHEDGDGTVTRSGALAAGARVMPDGDAWSSVHFVEGDHLGIMEAPAFLDDAFYLLLRTPAD